MPDVNIFERASRTKLTFPSDRGSLTVDQLWDLPLTSKAAGRDSLDGIARAVNTKLKEVTEDSFVATTPHPSKARFVLQLDILKHVIAIKQDEAKDARDKIAKAAEREKLIEALARKKDSAIDAMTEDDIRQRLAAL